MPKMPISHKHIGHQAKRRGPDKQTQRQLLSLQGNCCFYCGLKFDEWYHDGEFARVRKVHWDHVSPYSYTFNNKPENFVGSCARCNGIKSNKVFDDLEEAAAFIRARLREKGYPLSLEWGTKKIKKLILNKSIFEASNIIAEMPSLDASDEVIAQHLRDIKQYLNLLNSVPAAKAERARLRMLKAEAQEPDEMSANGL